MTTDAERAKEKMLAIMKMSRNPEQKKRMDARIEETLTSLTMKTGLPRWVVRHYVALTTAAKSLNCIEVVDMENGIFKLDPILMMTIITVIDAGTTDFDSFMGEMLNRECKQQKGGA